jgi:XTP/dITP diphosphohydrolase
MTAFLIATRNAHKVREIRQVLAADYLYLTLDDFPGAPAAVEDGATFAANAAKKVSVLADWLATEAGRAALLRRPNLIPSPADPGRARLRRAETEIAPALCILADDSGLEVDALDGAPGVHSARFAALDTSLPGNSPDRANNAKLLRLLEGVPPSRRTARFRCVLALRTLSLPFAEAAVHPEAAFNPQSAIRNPQFRPVLLEATCPGRIALQPAGSGGFGYDPLFIPDGFTQSFAELGEAVKNTLSHRARALEKLRQHLANLPPTATP